MENVSYTSGSIYYDGMQYDRQLVLKNTGGVYVSELNNDGTYSFVKLKNNICPVGTEVTAKEYKDIDTLTEEEKTSVNKLSKAEILNGTDENNFSPNKTVTRAEAAAMLLRMTEEKDSVEIPEFEDVTSNEWYYNTAGVSAKYGIINGYEDNTFRGDNAVTKLQLITLCARTLKNEFFGKIDDAYLSAPSNDGIPDWAQSDVNLALQEGLISEQDLDNADEEITRADAAVILYRLYDKI